MYDHENNQPCPRLIKNNLIFHKIKSLCAGPFNSALITDKGKVLIQGQNKQGQLALGAELGPMTDYFPEFRTIDSLKDPIA